MKKLILVVAAITMSLGAYSQVDKTNRSRETNKKTIDQSNSDGVVMRNGKVMTIKNGERIEFQDNEMMMGNGIKLLRDGTYILKDGSKTALKEGDHMDMKGNITPMKAHKDNTMYLVPDSTINK